MGSPTDVVLMVFRDCYSAQWKDHDRLACVGGTAATFTAGGIAIQARSNASRAILSASGSTRNVDVLKRAALQRMALDE